MSENEIITDGHHIIINGGNPLPGCPESWDDAHEWEDEVNKDTSKWEVPQWKFDCGFKLDHDGPILSVSSRFYPPKSDYGPRWDGGCEILLMGNTVAQKEFECDSLDELKSQVEAFVSDFIKTVGLGAMPVLDVDDGTDE